MARGKPETWRCDHRYPILVERAEAPSAPGAWGAGPSAPRGRGGAEQAMVALRAEAQAGQRLGA